MSLHYQKQRSKRAKCSSAKTCGDAKEIGWINKYLVTTETETSQRRCPHHLEENLSLQKFQSRPKERLVRTRPWSKAIAPLCSCIFIDLAVQFSHQTFKCLELRTTCGSCFAWYHSMTPSLYYLETLLSPGDTKLPKTKSASSAEKFTPKGWPFDFNLSSFSSEKFSGLSQLSYQPANNSYTKKHS